MATKQKANTLKAVTNAELLSYIINQNPELSEEIDLPVQGQDIKPIGKIIVSNQRYKNAFINTINLIGLTVIKRNGWDNPWNFTDRGALNFGQTIREMIVDLCNVYDYNEKFDDKTFFLKTQVPNVLSYLHELNFQKFYATTTSDAQLAMAFNSENGLFDLIDKTIGMLYESYKYDDFIINKYMLCRRILDGTMTSINIPNYSTLNARQKVSFIKNYSNKLTFRSPNYNPAGIRTATSFDDQILIVNTEFESDFSTEVLATSYFRDEADMRSRLVLTDSFSQHDTNRLKEVLGNQYQEFTTTEISQLANIPAVSIGREWFMNYTYSLDTTGDSLKRTDFYNPTTLENNHFLSVWKVYSTSPFENAIVFSSNTVAVTSVAITPNEMSVTAGQSVQLSANVVTTGFANKAVIWEISSAPGEVTPVTISQTGKVTIPSDYSVTEANKNITVKATSIYDETKSNTATITVL